MILHANAVLSRRQRRRVFELVAAGATVTAAALAVGCSRQTASKWVGRGRRGEGFDDRSSRPRRSPRRTPAHVEQAVLRARRELRLGPHPLGWMLGVAASTVHAILRRHECSRLRQPQPARVVRYERERPGELVHLDAKRLGRIARERDASGRLRGKKGRAGWLSVFVAVDDASRLAYARSYPDETTNCALAFLNDSLQFFERQGLTIESVLTDNGPCFKRGWGAGCSALGLEPLRTRPRRPQTNGKAERFIRTLLEDWAGGDYHDEQQRQHALPRYLDFYNRHRHHRALGGQTPLQRVNNVLGTNTGVPPRPPSVGPTRAPLRGAESPWASPSVALLG